MENENIKKLEELSKQAKKIGLSSQEENLPLKIMRIIQKALEENEDDITITPMMYSPEDFMPSLGIIVKDDLGFLRKKYDILLTKNEVD